MRAFVLVIAATACGGGESPPVDTADTEVITYRVTTASGEPVERPPADPAPVTFIDDIMADSLEQTYPDVESLFADVHVVELRHGGVVVASFQARPSGSCPVGAIRQYTQGLCVFASGDIRFGGDTIQGTDGTCVGDGFCISQCADTGCGAGERCTSRIVTTIPLASHLACAPIGPRAAGDTCTLIADAAGAFDDCGADLLCVDGTCRATCDPRFMSACANGCSFIPGHAPEIGICN